MRWDGAHAIVEDVDGSVASCDGRVYLDKSKELAREVARQRGQIRAMQRVEAQLRGQLQDAGLSAVASSDECSIADEPPPFATGASGKPLTPTKDATSTDGPGRAHVQQVL